MVDQSTSLKKDYKLNKKRQYKLEYKNTLVISLASDNDHMKYHMNESSASLIEARVLIDKETVVSK